MYNPGVQFDPSIITRTGDILAGGVSDYIKDGKKARTLRAALAPYAPEGDAGKAYIANLQTLGLPELEGVLQKEVITRSLDQFKQQQAHQNVQDAGTYMGIQHQAAQINAANREQADEGVFGQRLQQAVSPRFVFDGSGKTQTPTLGMPDIVNAAAAAPHSPTARALLVEAIRSQANNDSAPDFTANTTLVPGISLVGLRGSKQWQGFQTGAPELKQVSDGNGNSINVLVTPKGAQQVDMGGVRARDEFNRLSEVHKTQLRNAGEADGIGNAEAAKQWNDLATRTAAEMNNLFKPGKSAATNAPAGKVRRYNPATGTIE